MIRLYSPFFGFDQMPSQSTYSCFFAKFSQKRTSEVFPELQHWFFEQIDVDNITIDFDRMIITRDGEQEGSAKGYNPNKICIKHHNRATLKTLKVFRSLGSKSRQ